MYEVEKFIVFVGPIWSGLPKLGAIEIYPHRFGLYIPKGITMLISSWNSLKQNTFSWVRKVSNVLFSNVGYMAATYPWPKSKVEVPW